MPSHLIHQRWIEGTGEDLVREDPATGQVCWRGRAATGEEVARAVASARQAAFGLVAGLLSDDRRLYERFFAQVRAGVINFNRPTIGASSRLPFGGVGRSGNHRPSAYFAVDYCSYPVASLEAHTLGMPETPTPGIDP